MTTLHNNLINGQWVAGTTTSANLNPSNLSDVIGEYAQADADGSQLRLRPLPIGSSRRLTEFFCELRKNAPKVLHFDGSASALFSSKTLVYGRADYATACSTVPADIGNLSFTKAGWIAGVGIDHAFTDTISAQVEYNYSKFGSQDFAFDASVIFHF